MQPQQHPVQHCDSRSTERESDGLSVPSFRLLSERSGVRLSPGARSEASLYTPVDGFSVAKQSAKSLPKTVARKLGHNLLVVLTLAVVVLFSLAGQYKTSAIRPAVIDSSAALVEAHDCGDHVDDPTHAVVTIKGDTRYVGQRMTDRAIEQAVFGVDHGLTVHEFCA